LELGTVYCQLWFAPNDGGGPTGMELTSMMAACEGK